MYTPTDLGFPEAFPKFRTCQEEALEYAATSDKRFTGLSVPTGGGKSGVAYGAARLFGGRTVILTANLALEEQYTDDFGSVGLVDIQGRRNYKCSNGGTCEDGNRLDCREKDWCPYRQQFGKQNASDIVVTNYAYWLAVHEKSQGINPPDTLILDECHSAESWLSRSLDFEITERQCRVAGYKINPRTGENIDEWRKIYPVLADKATAEYESARGNKRDPKRARMAEQFLDSVKKIDRWLDESNWVISKDEGSDYGRRWRFECVWPGMYREKLFRGTQRIILLSATLRPKTMQILGIKKGEYDFKEWGRQFPAKNAPVLWIDGEDDLRGVRVNARITDVDKNQWFGLHQRILDARPDRRGLIHTISYPRAKEIGGYLGSRITLNGAADPESQTARVAFDKHIKGKADSVLCSPSFSTGWDFKGDRAEFQIISKLPILDMRPKVMQARRERDESYENYMAMQELVQACGRVQRYPEDRGETFIIDNSWQWFKGRAESFAPKHFSVRHESELPPSPPKL